MSTVSCTHKTAAPTSTFRCVSITSTLKRLCKLQPSLQRALTYIPPRQNGWFMWRNWISACKEECKIKRRPAWSHEPGRKRTIVFSGAGASGCVSNIRFHFNPIIRIPLMFFQARTFLLWHPICQITGYEPQEQMASRAPVCRNASTQITCQPPATSHTELRRHAGVTWPTVAMTINLNWNPPIKLSC